ncbi:MAG: hypothetical protein Q9212_002666 [Teloschistes hypoglaucus]
MLSASACWMWLQTKLSFRSAWKPPLKSFNLTSRQPRGQSEDALATMFQGLDGRKLFIPNMEALSPPWAMEINSHAESIRGDIDAWQSSQYKDAKIRKKLAVLNAVTFIAVGYPRTGREALFNITKFFIWFFPWDDALDDTADNCQPADVIRYRDDSIRLTKESLISDLERPSQRHIDPRIEGLWDIARNFRARMTPQSAQRLAKNLCQFISTTANDHIVKSGGKPRTVEAYLKCREVNIGVYPIMELTFYADKVELPRKWRPENNATMAGIWKETAWAILIVNDLLSLPKELQQGQYDSLVPLLMYHRGLTLQAAVDQAVQMLHEVYDRLQKFEVYLSRQLTSEHAEEVKACVQTYKNLAICNLNWSYGCRRYLDQSNVQNDGSLAFEIKAYTAPTGNDNPLEYLH